MANLKEKFIVDSNGWITGKGKGLKEEDYNHTEDEIQNGVDPEEIEPADPANNSKAWNWKGGNPEKQDTGNNIPPEPDEAIDKIFQKFVEWEGDQAQGLARADKLLNQLPSVVLGLLRGNYDRIRGRISEAKKLGTGKDLTESEEQAIFDILDGKA